MENLRLSRKPEPPCCKRKEIAQWKKQKRKFGSTES